MTAALWAKVAFLFRKDKWVEAAGFNGFNEVEIFSNKFWKDDQGEFLKRIIKAYREKT